MLWIHGFVTAERGAELHARNDAGYAAFLLRLGCMTPATPAPSICGPVIVPGPPLFPKPVPLYLGKITTTIQ